MIYTFIKKEINDFFKSKTTILFIILFSALISYSFYSAVTLYSKASVAAIDNPLYATGFEPVVGVFVPTLGGLFIILSLIAPFLFSQTISNEKRDNTIILISQFPISLKTIFSIKLLSAVIFLLSTILLLTPLFIIWHFLGGDLPFAEISILILGHILYGILVVSISIFSASIFENSAQSSILALSIIIFSWFLDFGKDMNILPFIDKISDWSITKQLKYFENGILSLKTIIYFILLICFFSFIAYLFFNFSIRDRFKKLFITVFIFFISLYINSYININFDLTKSRRNSFSVEKTEFLQKLPQIKIEIYLEQTDSRAKDYNRDFLTKLKLVKSDIKLKYMVGKSLKKDYGIFRYTINKKSETTFSNSEEEIFMVFENLSGIKVAKKPENSIFKGNPIVAKGNWSLYLFIFYLLIIPLGIISIYFKNYFYRSTK